MPKHRAGAASSALLCRPGVEDGRQLPSAAGLALRAGWRPAGVLANPLHHREPLPALLALVVVRRHSEFLSKGTDRVRRQHFEPGTWEPQRRGPLAASVGERQPSARRAGRGLRGDGRRALDRLLRAGVARPPACICFAKSFGNGRPWGHHVGSRSGSFGSGAKRRSAFFSAGVGCG